jgi:hypothetical protein
MRKSQACHEKIKGLAVQSLVSCGGGRRPADGLRQQHVRTIRLLVWDTLEDFTATLTYTWDETKDDSAC